MVMEKYVSQDSELPFLEKLIMKFHFWLKDISLFRRERLWIGCQ
jgi:KUP system potassium uptake protein